MELSVFLAVLAAALMHAGWNAMVRSRLDRFSSVLLLTIVCAVLALGLMPFFAVPARAAWPWLGTSLVIHTFYLVFLARAYEHGDLSQVYPLARGSAPLAVAIISVVFLGEAVTATRMAAVAAIGGGVMLMSLRGGANFGAIPRKALYYALGTAVSIAAYTLSDGLGARASENASGYTMWLFFLNGLTLSAYALIERGPRVFAKIAPQWRNGLA